MPRALSVFLSAVLIAGTVGCDRGSEPRSATPTGPPLVLGLIPEQDIFRQLERYEPIAEYLESAVGREIELKALRRYGNIIENFQRGEMDGAFFGSFTYALAHARIQVEVLARPESPDGTSSYHGLLLVREDSGIRGLDDMEGKVFAFVDRATTAGYIFPLAYFHRWGLQDYRSYFRETYFTGTHRDVILDVLDGKADAGALKNTVYERFLAENPEEEAELRVLARSPDVPENALAVRHDLPEDLRDRLEQALLHMHEDPQGAAALEAFGERRFIPTSDEDYEPVLHYAREAGIDMEIYEYVNE